MTLNTAAAAMSGYPAISPKYIQWWKDSARAAKGNPVSSQAPQVGASKHKPGDKVKLKNGQTITIKNVSRWEFRLVGKKDNTRTPMWFKSGTRTPMLCLTARI